MPKDWLAIVKVNVTAKARMIQIWQFLLYFDSLATKLGLMIHHRKPECHVKILDDCIQGQGQGPFASKPGLIVNYHKPECFMQKLDCCVQGQGHSKISKCQWKFVQMISSELLNYQTWYGDASLWARLSFKKIGLLSSRSQLRIVINIVCLFNILSELLILSQLNLVCWHIIIRWIVLVKRLDCSVMVKVKVTEEEKKSTECSSGQYLLSCRTSCYQLGMVMLHHGPKYHAKRLGCCLQVQGHSEGSFD